MNDLQQHIQNLTAAINEGCGQHLVRDLRGGHIFAGSTTFVKGDDLPYAFNDGGREGLQFNIGFEPGPDRATRFRYGVAFSFQPSRNYPNVVEVLQPKAARFDEYFGVHSNRQLATVQGFNMWYWEPGDAIPCKDKDPQNEVCSASELAREGVFLMFGKNFSLSYFEQFDIPHWSNTVLDDFDLLFGGVYRFVEGGAG